MPLSPSTDAVLVVDDEPVIRELICNMFRGLGFEVHDTYDGHRALEMLANHPDIGLLFADVRMPGLNGIELAAEAQRLRPGLQVILTSGYVREGARALEGWRFLPKPFRAEALAAAVAGEAGTGKKR